MAIVRAPDASSAHDRHGMARPGMAAARPPRAGHDVPTNRAWLLLPTAHAPAHEPAHR